MINTIKADVFNKLNKYPERLFHVINVVLTAQSLSLIYNVDLKDTFIAGLMHDYAKYESMNFYKEYISAEDIIKYSETNVAYHSISAANYALKKYHINDDIYNAISNHVFGRPNMSQLEKIIFVSDSIVFNGKNNTIKLYEIAVENLEKAVLEAIKLTRLSLERRNLRPHKRQIETYDYYYTKEFK